MRRDAEKAERLKILREIDEYDIILFVTNEIPKHKPLFCS
jgi:hypothetical protein